MALTWAHLFLAVIVVERGIHQLIASRNEVQIKKLGGKEFGAGFTRVLIGFHVCWFISFGIEAAVRGRTNYSARRHCS